VIFTEIIKVLQNLSKNHILVENNIKKISPLDIKQLENIENLQEVNKSEDSMEFLLIFKEFARLFELWKKIQNSENSINISSIFIYIYFHE